MKQLLTGVLMSALISASLVGCTVADINDAATTTDPTPAKDLTKEMGILDPEDETATYINRTAAFTFEYPKTMHMNVTEHQFSIPEIFVTLGEEYHESGHLKSFIRLILQADEYDEYMAENSDGMYMELENNCEVDEPLGGTPFDCEEVSSTTTTYMMVERMGDLGLSKRYYIETGNDDWPEMEIRIDLFTDDFIDQYEDRFAYEEMETTFKSGELTAEQKHRLEVAEAIIDTLKFK